VLEVDHIHPCAEGGSGELINLVTSCEPCNRGKGARLLGDVRPRPDADLLYLEAQQETVEIRRFLEVKDQRIALRNQVVEWLRYCWVTHMDKWTALPEDRTFEIWFDQYEPDNIEYAIRCAGGKDRGHSIQNRGMRHETAIIIYIAAVLRNQERDREKTA
jgi:hypothetical protein